MMQRRSEDTHKRILDAAYHLFSRLGYDATSVAEICQAAGVSKGAFYHHFPTKQGVFQELLHQWLARLDASFQAALREDVSVPQAVTVMASQAGEILRSSDAPLAIFLEFWRQAHRDPQLWETVIQPYRHYQEFFTRLIQSGIDAGSIDDVDPKVAARVLVSLALGLLLGALFDPRSADWSTETVRSVALLMSRLEKGE